MIKKLTLASVATLALILVPAQAKEMKCAAGKCGAGMMKKAKQGGKKHKMKQKMGKKRNHSPFLVKHGLPHLTKMVMMNWDDAKFGLTAKQKTELTAVRKETMGALMRLKPEVRAMAKEIVQGSKAGTRASELKSKVEKLASLEAEATMVQLNCIDHTKEILTKEQLKYLKKKRKAQ